MIRLYNSLSRQLEDFVPLNPSRVTLYACGPTVYDTPHLGNARPAVIFDILFRLLGHHYPHVEYARNYTDVDDKIMERAAENGEPISDLTARTIAEYREVTDALGCARPTHEPTATGAIADMIEMILTLIASGHAYEAEQHVLFHIPSYPEHGTLSRHNQEDLKAGHRVEVESYKRHPTDFVLWKPSDADQPGWDSPWGRGRPGWHIECSAMIKRHLGLTIDIHAGGGDLRFPHHDCEISQSQCANNAPLARYWVHNGMLLVNGEKMSKSTGNFLTVRDALKSHSGPVIRLALLMGHYRAPLDWTPQLLSQASSALTGWHQALDGIEAAPEANIHANAILDALATDLNTPAAIAEIHGLVRLMRTTGNVQEIAAGIRYAARTLGFDLMDNAGFLRGGGDAEVEALVAERSAARARRDFAESDRLRAVLKEKGIIVEDTKDGSTWHRG